MQHHRQFRWSVSAPGNMHALEFATQPGPTRTLAGGDWTLSRDEELSPRDEAIFLLQTAAEIEHALLVQYLYAAYSLQTDSNEFGPEAPEDAAIRASKWQECVIQIAKEEMAHLLTVQNVLRVLGGALHFDRESLPLKTPFYPFSLALRPLDKTRLAMFIQAERPDDVSAVLTTAEETEINGRAIEGDASPPIIRVHALYDRLIGVISVLDPGLFNSNVEPALALPTEWSHDTPGLIIAATQDQRTAIDALKTISAQGEGSPDQPLSHFQRFVNLYRAFPETDPIRGRVSWTPVRPVVSDPNTLTTASPGQITDDRSLRLAKFTNIRYRILLTSLQQSLLYQRGDQRRTYLVKKIAFEEMRQIAKLSDVLMNSPAKQAQQRPNAGPPFELPYSLALSDHDPDRWRLFLDMFDASKTLAGTEPALASVLNSDNQRRSDIASFVNPTV